LDYFIDKFVNNFKNVSSLPINEWNNVYPSIWDLFLKKSYLANLLDTCNKAYSFKEKDNNFTGFELFLSTKLI